MRLSGAQFAAQCLPLRLKHVKRTLPQVSLNFVRYQHAHDFATPHEFDAAIQYGYGNWPSANARYLIGKETSIVCSPQLRDTLPLRTPQDLLRAALLQHIEVPLAWQDWMEATAWTPAPAASGRASTSTRSSSAQRFQALVWASCPPAWWKTSWQQARW